MVYVYVYIYGRKIVLLLWLEEKSLMESGGGGINDVSLSRFRNEALPSKGMSVSSAT